MVNLSRLEEIKDLRTVWSHEALVETHDEEDVEVGSTVVRVRAVRFTSVQ